MSEFKALQRFAPNYPNDTCPDIDGVIETMEKLRKDNSDLRENAGYWREECKRLSEENASLQAEVDQLKNEIATLVLA